MPDERAEVRLPGLCEGFMHGDKITGAFGLQLEG